MDLAVWVVDDDESHRELVALLLETHCTSRPVRTFAGGAQLLATLRSIDPAAWPGLLLVDFHMPGLDAPGVLRALHAGGLRIPTVVTSSSASAAERAACLRAGAAAFVQKPARVEELIQGLVQIVAHTPPSSGSFDVSIPHDFPAHPRPHHPGG